MSFAIRFEGVTKRYLRGGPRYRSLREDAAARIRRAASRLRGRRVEPKGTLALEDISFTIDEGESVALIGPNGSGKTTALKLVTRISYPTAGRVSVRGRVAALIEVGSGIHTELTARENIWLYGRILGMSRGEVRRRFDEIVGFAEIGPALDRQVKLFSTGMQLRLGFSIASHLDPHVFLVDEALAVGDADFRQRCVERMAMLVGEGRTLVFVSHDLAAAEALCGRAIFFRDGRLAADGRSGDVIGSYLEWVDRAHRADAGDDPGIGPRQIEHASCYGAAGDERYAFRTGEDVEIRLRLGAAWLERGARLRLIVRKSGPRAEPLLTATWEIAEDPGPGAVVSCVLRDVPLLPGIYELHGSVGAASGEGGPTAPRPLGSFRIAEGPDGHDRSAGSPVHVDREWRFLPSDEIAAP